MSNKTWFSHSDPGEAELLCYYLCQGGHVSAQGRHFVFLTDCREEENAPLKKVVDNGME